MKQSATDGCAARAVVESAVNAFSLASDQSSIPAVRPALHNHRYPSWLNVNSVFGSSLGCAAAAGLKLVNNDDCLLVDDPPTPKNPKRLNPKRLKGCEKKCCRCTIERNPPKE